MSLSPLDQFLNKVVSKLPEIVSDKDLVLKLPEIFKSYSYLSRLRTKKQSPSYFHISPSCVRYLRDDILIWLRERYQESVNGVEDVCT